jgi:hypothetical protein
MEIDILEKLYRIGMLGAVMGLEGSKIIDDGRAFDTKIGDYTLRSYYCSYDTSFEINYVSVYLVKDTEFVGDVFTCEKHLPNETYYGLLVNDSNLPEEVKQSLREEFIDDMFSNRKNVKYKKISSDQNFGLLKSDKLEFRHQIFSKLREVEEEYETIKSNRGLTKSKLLTATQQ